METIVQDEKGTIFILGYERQQERQRCKAFQQIKASSPTKKALVLPIWEMFLPVSDGEFTKPSQNVLIFTKNQTASPHHGV